MSLLFYDGCDHLDARAEVADKWTFEDIASVNTTGGRFGGGCYELAPIFDEIYQDITGVTEVFAGVQVKMPTLGTNEELMLFKNGTASQIEIEVTGQAGSIRVNRGGSVIIDQSAGGVITTDTWHSIEVRVVHSNTVGVVQVHVDGVQVINFSGDTIPASAADIDRIEFRAPTFTGNALLDDFYILDTNGSAPVNTFLGDWKIDTIFPDGDGNYTEFDTTNGSATHALNVDDNPPDDDTTYNETATANDRDTFTMANLAAITSQVVFSVQQVTRAEGISGTSNFQNMFRISASDYNSSSFTTTQNVYLYFLTINDLNPDSAAAWTETIINGLESGVEHISSNTTRVTQHCLEVLRQNTAPLLRVSQVGVQVLRQADGPLLRVSQLGVQIMRSQLAPPFGRVTQVALEVAREEPLAEGYVTQVALEVARVSIPGPQPGLRSWMVFDTIHSVEVLMVSGTAPTSAADELTVLNGANVGLLGQEIIQWRDVTDLGDNVYRLSHLLRGRLGSEPFMNSHSIGELFVVLDSDTVRRVSMNTTDLDIQRYYKIIGAGLSGFSAPVTTHINTGVSQKPWQPVFFEATRAGDDITFTWERRSRIAHHRILQIPPPIGEQDERYEIDILDSGSSVVRVIEVTATTAEYSGADQTTDFGSAQNPVLAEVFQLSRVVDRGYGNRKLL